MRHRQKPREGGDRIPADESFFRRFAAPISNTPNPRLWAYLLPLLRSYLPPLSKTDLRRNLLGSSQVAVQRQASPPAVEPASRRARRAGGSPGRVRHRGAILRAADAALIREHACRQLRPI